MILQFWLEIESSALQTVISIQKAYIMYVLWQMLGSVMPRLTPKSRLESDVSLPLVTQDRRLLRLMFGPEGHGKP